MRPRPFAVLRSLAVLLIALAAAPPAAAAPGGAPSSTAAPTAIRGGNVLHSAAGRCTVGFNATKAGTYYALLAGRCVGGAKDWYADAARTVHVGVTEAVRFPGTDYAVIRYTNPAVSYPGEIDIGGSHLDVTGAAQPAVGQTVCLPGSTPAVHCGPVRALNVSVSHPEGTVTGLVQAAACAEPGAVGRPAVSGRTAIGILIGGSGSCASGGTAYLQPVLPALRAFGLTLH
ncbi:streptogrisin B precursor [Streptomyces albofaciens JCM 4342]|uniref:S1 family peptidase n=1 Tax=Streptomyces albofaciens TaxID=66866 RepID=UPI00123A76FD|nr:S1 family peptidase [Streptomyces albofaciens]KAA6213901.1 streptogrisin B precursor [Streptomyces albofaciens JCM 4342]